MLKVINPYTQEVIQEIKTDTEESIQKKFHQAMIAQKKWAQTPLEKRISIVQEFNQKIQNQMESLAKVMSLETGKPITQSHNEIKGVKNRIQFFLDHVQESLKEQSFSNLPNFNEKITREPLGVIANISAWNYPYFVGSNVFIPALLCGNAVLYKPSEYAAMTGLEMTRVFQESGLPEHLFQPILGGAEEGTFLLKQPVHGVFFTGSYQTGKAISLELGGRMIRTQFELGGKDPIYVCDDVDIPSAIESTVDGSFYNAGQSCCAIERLYVHKNICAPFIEEFVKKAQAYILGDPLDSKTQMGPLTQVQNLEHLEHQVQDALKKGAKLLCGGKRTGPKKNFFEPTVLTQVNHSMLLMKDESFGPIIGIQEVSNDEEAIEKMNDTEFGLTAGIYTKDSNRAQKILLQMNSGSVYWNCCDRVSPCLPWSGRKHSGLGSTLSLEGIQTMTQPKAWHLNANC